MSHTNNSTRGASASDVNNLIRVVKDNIPGQTMMFGKLTDNSSKMWVDEDDNSSRSEAAPEVEPQITWENPEDKTYDKTLKFSDLTPGMTYKVIPVKSISTKYGLQFIVEVTDPETNESFQVFTPNNYKDRVRRLCGTCMVTHMLKYEGLSTYKGRKIHEYKIGKFTEAE